MQRRFTDVTADDVADDAKFRTTFIGGTEHADLWVVDGGKVLICQYEDPNSYVSYHTASAVWEDAKGMLTEAHNNRGGLRDIDTEPDSTMLFWRGDEHSLDNHDPKTIARYLLLFAPWALTEDAKAEMAEAL